MKNLHDLGISTHYTAEMTRAARDSKVRKTTLHTITPIPHHSYSPQTMGGVGLGVLT